MASVTVRNLPDEVHHALRLRAAHHGRSTEAEVRSILARVVLQQSGQEDMPSRIGTFLSQGRVKLTSEEHATFERARGRSPARAAEFD